MKKLLITCLAFIAIVLPSLAQVDHDYNPNNLEAGSGFSLKSDQIPPAILKAASTDFVMSKPLTWTKFPYALQTYGWVYDKGAADLNLDHYEVNMKATNGNEFFAVYSKEGNLIQTREMAFNVLVPPSVLESLSNSQYKDWKIVGDKEVIRYFHDKNNVEQHFRLTVEKDNVKRSISFNYKGTAGLANK